MEALETLGVDFRLVIVQGIGFVLLFMILKKFLFGKILEVINSREEEIKERYAKSDREKAEAVRLQEDYGEKISKIEAEAEQRIQDAVKEAKEISENIIQKTNEKAEEIKNKAKKEIEQEKQSALAEIKKEVVTLSILSASKILEETINPQIAERLVDNAIEEIGGLLDRGNGNR